MREKGMAMKLEEAMGELEKLGSDRMKKYYMGNGAQEPLFGVATGAMKPLFKKIKKDQALAEELYATGNYDAMYFAGMIADPKAMTGDDFDRWMEKAYFYMASDYIVAVTLAEAECAQAVACRWIDSGKELHMSAGWACFEWLLGWRPDSFFDAPTIRGLLEKVAATMHGQPGQARRAMNNFVAAAGVSFLPLHDEALETAKAIGKIKSAAKGACAFQPALGLIQKAIDKGRLGFKRKAVRC
jgi:hypothetical protein